jgi:hypothetical protein
MFAKEDEEDTALGSIQEEVRTPESGPTL